MDAKQRIERLKYNLSKFGILSAEDRECFRTVGIENCRILSNIGEWCPIGLSQDFIPDCRYSIKPDYEREANVVECEVYQASYGWLVFDYKGKFEIPFINAMGKPNFIGYKYAGSGMIYSHPRACVPTVDRPANTPTHVLFAEESHNE